MRSRHDSVSCVALVLVAAALLAGGWPQAQQLQKITINYPTRSGASWPLYIAKEGGYYQKYGLDVDLQFGVHPAGIAMLTSGQAAMVNHSLEQGMVASSQGRASFALIGSSSNKGLFALMAQKTFTDPKELKGKRIAVSQIGDAPYNYTVALLGTYGLGVRDVQWIPVGTDVTGRAAALQTNRADATLLTAPAYFRLEEAATRTWRTWPTTTSTRRPSYLFSKKAIDGEPEAAGADHQGARRGDQALLRRQGVRREGLHRVRQAARGRRRPHLRPLQRRATSSTASRTCWRRRVKAIVAQQVDPRLAAD